MSVSAWVLIVVIVLVLVAMSRKSEGSVAWGQVITGAVVAVLLMGTVIGPSMQEFVQWIAGGLDARASELWAWMGS